MVIMITVWWLWGKSVFSLLLPTNFNAFTAFCILLSAVRSYFLCVTACHWELDVTATKHCFSCWLRVAASRQLPWPAIEPNLTQASVPWSWHNQLSSITAEIMGRSPDAGSGSCLEAAAHSQKEKAVNPIWIPNEPYQAIIWTRMQPNRCCSTRESD